MKRKIKMFLFMGLVAVMVATVFFYLHLRRRDANKKIRVSGNIEAQEVRLSFRVGGKIAQLLVDEGSSIKAEQILARLETDELTKIRDQAKASLKSAEAQYALDKVDAERAQNLFQTGAISAQKKDSVLTKADAKQAELEALRATFELAETRLGFANLYSPIDGFVLVKSAEVGEVVQPGATIFSAVNLHDIWLTAYINETDLGRVKLNQNVEIKTDTYPKKVYRGYVSFISQEAEFTPKQIQTTEERVKLVYRIKIKVDNTALELKPGMPADGYIIE
ncbi:MAG: efflux RND transporter periplasmic adaptor subunit [Candidatus Omnitrophica bacterium]|nr:efflux RND transporter periplasmic adaptor subunit [Candidatus Omnitrophota bacterium]